ncbi:nonribosomal peptide synthetase MxaA [methane-oxidizing endosymbiont of Gigantopelta aegis]|uniref:nonribosomal peptide synthetase MxaA n=1 Tax=methane-oxidizing endosymbiont of Gigantopelta aegis TaxID=2794938 RepID=UPI0018DB07F2|nr:nonribosomal peptide synthetase MxaA [methane-oxidizing endosymbiont of Gigantopelta aegis]
MRYPFVFVLIIVLLSAAACSQSINEPITFFQVQTPRPFGYVIGDEIKQRILIETRPGLVLQRSSLPARGAVNRWLDLKRIDIDKTTTGTGVRYRIDLTYQLFYAPLEVKMLELPSFTLQFKQFGHVIEKKVPGWHFTAAPLRELAVRKEDGKEYMRPDAPAPLLDSRSLRNRLIISLAIVLGALFYLAWLYGRLRFLPQYRVFKVPCQQLARYSAGDLTRMLNIMHGALNQLNGKPLFQHQLADFYQRFPHYQSLDDELNWFFDYSNQHFFDSSPKGGKKESDKIKALCRHCLQIERGMR